MRQETSWEGRTDVVGSKGTKKVGSVRKIVVFRDLKVFANVIKVRFGSNFERSLCSQVVSEVYCRFGSKSVS